jgi:NosR/NirI family nitrous oxide reductase transcriptional regulator
MSPSATARWRLLLGFGLMCMLAPAPAATLEHYLRKLTPDQVFPGAVRVEATAEDPTLVTAHGPDGPIGHLFLNTDYAQAIGYSGRPIHVVVGLDNDGVIRSAHLVEHHEPIVLIGIPEHKITRLLDNYLGVDVVALASQPAHDRTVDAISGATVTVMVIDDSVLRSAVKVARQLGLGGLQPSLTKADAGPVRTIDPDLEKQQDWIGLVGDGSLRRLRLTVADVNAAFERSDDPKASQRPETGAEDDTFIELYAALVSVPSIGLSVLGPREYGNLRKSLAEGEQAVLLAASGRYSFKGSGYVRGGIFDRFQIIQGDNSVRFRDRQHKRLRRVKADGAPEFTEVDLFRIPTDAGFDPTQSWHLELLVSRATGAITKAFVTFGVDYVTPEHYLRIAPPPPPAIPLAAPAATPGAGSLDALLGAPAMTDEDDRPPIWQQLWYAKAWQVAVLSVALTLLTVVFFFQDSLVKHARLTEGLRVGFLVFTLFGIGFYANAQLSVVNILTVLNALVTGFDWTYFLMEPLIFILWGSVGAALLFWGRGAYCGWLCPFGALQELMNRVARALRVPQLRLPWGLHERLWALKYIIFLVLFGVSLHSLAWAERLAEVEPFKTAIILKFVRDWPFVLFAVALLLPGLFIERFYCRYFCALGAALAIPARLRMFDWLKRYKQCGSPCQICAKGCMVQAIHPDGQINPNECLYCLHCQELYYDDHRCPVMIQRRQKRERATARASETSGEQIAELLNEIQTSRTPPAKGGTE